MGKVKRTNVFLVLAMAFVVALSCFVEILTWTGNKNINASAETDITDTIALENRSWGALEGEYYFGVSTDGKYLNTADNVSGCWYLGREDLIANNNGIDITEYIHVNGKSAKQWITENTQLSTPLVGVNGETTTAWLSNPAASPICVQTSTATGNMGLQINILKEAVGEPFTITFKEGFSVIAANGEVVKISDDVDFLYASGTLTKETKYTLTFDGVESRRVAAGATVGELPALPETEGKKALYWAIDGVEITADTVYNYGANKTATPFYVTDLTDTIALENRSWGALDGEYYFGVSTDGEYLNTADNVSGCWYLGREDLIANNNGIDITEYIHVNGKSAKQWITENTQLSTPLVGESGWISNPAASPICVQTSTATGNMGLEIRILKAAISEPFTVTFKQGFSVIAANGETVYLSTDVTYEYTVVDGVATLEKIEPTDGDGEKIHSVTLMNGNETYLTEQTDLLTLPAIPSVSVGKEGLSQVFVGWTTDTTAFSDLYPAGYPLDVTEEITLHAVWIGFELQDGAMVRVTAGSSGIRFLTDIDANGYQSGVEQGWIAGAGTFLVPTDYLATGVEFIHSNFEKEYCIDNETKVWKVQGETDATWTYVAAFVNISEAQYSRKLSARGYLKVNFTCGEGYVYTPYDEELNARSIYQVAMSAYNDERHPEYKTNETILDYINSVANVTWNVEDNSVQKTEGVVGNYEITSASAVDNTLTVGVDGDVSSAIINGKRLAAGTTSYVQIGEVLYKISNFEIVEGGFKFTFERVE